MADAAVILLYGLKTNVYADPRTAPAGGVDRTPPGFEGSPSNIRINPTPSPSIWLPKAYTHIFRTLYVSPF
jgi:hypothetical protein